MAAARARGAHSLLTPEARCRRRFLGVFPGGFRDETYLEWERDYKWAVHREWQGALGKAEMRRLLGEDRHPEVAARALRVEQRSRHPMLFSFEKMALRDAVRQPEGARAFGEGLYDMLHGVGSVGARFEAWCETLASLPRRQTRVLTWPVATVFGFIAQPRKHLFIKPKTLRAAARSYGHEISYASRPSWTTYSEFLGLAARVREDLADLEPRDMIDLQSFLWVQGSDEYA